MQKKNFDNIVKTRGPLERKSVKGGFNFHFFKKKHMAKKECTLEGDNNLSLVSHNIDFLNKREYTRSRFLLIKQDREEILSRYAQVPQRIKFKSSITNGFSAHGLSEEEVIEILDMFSKKFVMKKTAHIKLETN
jgi:hypothetical protein